MIIFLWKPTVYELARQNYIEYEKLEQDLYII